MMKKTTSKLKSKKSSQTKTENRNKVVNWRGRGRKHPAFLRLFDMFVRDTSFVRDISDATDNNSNYYARSLVYIYVMGKVRLNALSSRHAMIEHVLRKQIGW